MTARAPGFLSARPRRLWAEIGAAPGDPLEVRPIATGPGARWLNRVVPVGAPPYSGTVLRMHGEIKLGRWQPFTAEQVISRVHASLPKRERRIDTRDVQLLPVE